MTLSVPDDEVPSVTDSNYNSWLMLERAEAPSEPEATETK